MPLIPYASFLAGAILSLVMPVGLLLVITAYFHVARKRVPEPPAPAGMALDTGVGAPTAVHHETPATARPAPTNPVATSENPGAGKPGTGGEQGAAPGTGGQPGAEPSAPGAGEP